jgi:hypothetical protein
MLMLLRACGGACSALTRAHQVATYHRTWTCTTRRATAGPGIPQASGNLVKGLLGHRWRLDWCSLQGARQQVCLFRVLALRLRRALFVVLWCFDGGRAGDAARR